MFALAAGSRAAVQIATRFREAPLAYSLSAFAAAVYIVLTVALVRGNRTLALAACGVELAGVLIIGTLSMVGPRGLPARHGLVRLRQRISCSSLVLPILGLYWLLRRR